MSQIGVRRHANRPIAHAMLKLERAENEQLGSESTAAGTALENKVNGMQVVDVDPSCKGYPRG